MGWWSQYLYLSPSAVLHQVWGPCCSLQPTTQPQPLWVNANIQDRQKYFWGSQKVTNSASKEQAPRSTVMNPPQSESPPSSRQLYARKIPNMKAGWCLCHLPRNLPCYAACFTEIPHSSSCLMKKSWTFRATLASGQRGAGPSFKYTDAMIYRFVSKPEQESYHFSLFGELKPGEMQCFLISLT